MKMRLFILLLAVTLPLGASSQANRQGTRAQSPNEQIKDLLHYFLTNVDKPEAHDRFWSKDLVYTGASGKVRTKAEIMKSVTEEAGKPADPKDGKTTYDAEDVSVHNFGSFAVLNFRLVAHNTKDGKTETNNYRNTGTLRQENGKWKIVGWQATKVDATPPPTK